MLGSRNRQIELLRVLDCPDFPLHNNAAETVKSESLKDIVSGDPKRSGSKGYRYSSSQVTYGGIEQRWMVVESEERKKSDSKKILDRLEKEAEKASKEINKMGAGDRATPCITMRLVEIQVGKAWYSYLTSVLDPLILPPYVVADLYGRSGCAPVGKPDHGSAPSRWRIEEAFNTVKRLLGLS